MGFKIDFEEIVITHKSLGIASFPMFSHNGCFYVKINKVYDGSDDIGKHMQFASSTDSWIDTDYEIEDLARNSSWDLQILPQIFDEFNFARGKFYIDALSEPSNSILDERIAGDAFKADLHGDSFWLHSLFDSTFTLDILRYMYGFRI